jgi:Zn-dependent alcohol dehydrogenase
VVGARQDSELPSFDFVLSEKRAVGSNSFRVDMPRFVDFILTGQLKLDEMTTGAVAQSVIVFD